MRLLSTVWARLASFTIALVVAFGVAYAVGNQFPESAAAAPGHGGHATTNTIDESPPHPVDDHELRPGEVPFTTSPLPAASDAPTVDGFVVRRDGLTFTVTTPDGAPAAGLEPYLGMPAHLAVLGDGDLAFTHLHAAGSTMPGMPEMTMPATDPNVFEFNASLPAGTYRAYLQFGHDGDVVTVPFTITLP